MRAHPAGAAGGLVELPALPLAARRAGCLAELREVADAPRLPDDFTDRRLEAVSKLKADESTRRELQATLDRLEHELAAVSAPDELLRLADRLDQLVSDRATNSKAYVDDRPKLLRDLERLEQEANERLASSAVGKTTPPDKVAAVFESIRAIHIARGRDLDKTLAFNIEQTRRYVGDPPAQRRLDPADSAECLARVAEIDAARAEYDQANTARIESLYEKRKYTDEDRREIAEYQRKLAAFANRIFFERQQCAAAQ